MFRVVLGKSLLYEQTTTATTATTTKTNPTPPILPPIEAIMMWCRKSRFIYHSGT